MLVVTDNVHYCTVKHVKDLQKFCYLPFQGDASFIICVSCLTLVNVILSCLFLAALWSPAGKGLTSWLLYVMFSSVFVTFPYGVLGQVWYLIVSIPDLCLLPYFDKYDHNLK